MSVEQLCRTVTSAVKDRLKREAAQNSVKRGQITNDGVHIGGRCYPYSAAIDMAMNTGDWVYVVMNDAGTKAVIVGR